MYNNVRLLGSNSTNMLVIEPTVVILQDKVVQYESQRFKSLLPCHYETDIEKNITCISA